MPADPRQRTCSNIAGLGTIHEGSETARHCLCRRADLEVSVRSRALSASRRTPPIRPKTNNHRYSKGRGRWTLPRIMLAFSQKIAKFDHNQVEAGISVQKLKKLEEACSVSQKDMTKRDRKLHCLNQEKNQKHGLLDEKRLLWLRYKFIARKSWQIHRKPPRTNSKKWYLKREFADLRFEYERRKDRMRSIEIWIDIMSEEKDVIYDLNPLCELGWLHVTKQQW